MEETLGKRIIANRKRVGLTQEKMAEQLGVTAQAVSKWENDQSCPDITMLPRLAEIFGITTDALLGIRQEEIVHPAELVTEADTEPEGIHFNVNNDTAGKWEFKWDGGRKSGVGFALWVLLVGGLLLASNYLHWGADLWSIAWPSGLMLFGLFGLLPRFSFFRLGCALFGGYFLLNNLSPGLFALDKNYLLPVFLLLFGLSLLADALRKNKRPSFKVFRNGQQVYTKEGANVHTKNRFTMNGEVFDCSVSFGEDRKLIDLPRLSGGSAEVSFGELTLDLTGCEEFAEDCRVNADCSFGQLNICVPRHCRVDPVTSTAFGSVDISGAPDADAGSVIRIACNASFGEIQIRYV